MNYRNTISGVCSRSGWTDVAEVSRLQLRALAVTIALLACVGKTALTAEVAAPVTTSSSSGEYQTVWLQLEQGGVAFDSKKKERFDVPLFLGVRDGKAVVAWFVHLALSGGRVVWLDAASLRISETKLSGSLDGRTNLHWGNKNVHYFSYTLDAVIGDLAEGRKPSGSARPDAARPNRTAPDGLRRSATNSITGSFSVGFIDDAGERINFSGKLSGHILTDEQTATDTLATGHNWPQYYGDGFGLSGPASKAKLIGDLAQARPVWKSETYIPTGYGSAPDNRYPDRAGRAGNGGGSSSPVVVEGRVYQFFYYPRGPVGQSKPYLENFIGRPFTGEADLLKKARELFPQRSCQQDAVLNHFRTQADEILVCMDAATGQTLWKTTFPQRGNNYQTHKHRGHFPVALVVGGVVYQPGTTGRLYAVDAVTGKLLWEYPDAQPEAHVTKHGGIDCHAPSPVLVDGVVVFAALGRVHGVDAKTGAKKWETPLWHRTSLLPWPNLGRFANPSHENGKSLIIASDRDHEKKQNFAVAIDPADGRIVWRQPVEYLIDFTFPLLAGDLLVGYSLNKENVKPGENDGLAILHAYKITAGGLKPAWTTKPLSPIIDTIGMAIDGEHIFVSASREAICVKLATGDVLARVENVGGARTQTAFLAGDRLFIQPEGRHGGQSFLMLSADANAFRAFPAKQSDDRLNHRVGGQYQWLPPHTWTTAYANQPIVYPLVDGRLFVRGLDAIYCYDLRQQAAP